MPIGPPVRLKSFQGCSCFGNNWRGLIGLYGGDCRASSFRQYGHDYYVNLLALRKRLGVVAHRDLQAALGREPSDSELKRYLSETLHARDVVLAFKGWKHQGARNYLADEELVVTSVMTAILTGRETVILTRDTDVFEQFVKLVGLMVSDYWCSRFADFVRHFSGERWPMFPWHLAHKFP
jgi:hypothetical protein